MKYLALSFLFSLSTLAAEMRAPVVFAATTTSAQALAFNPTRCTLIIQNDGPGIIRVKGGAAHTGSEGVKIQNGGNWEPPVGPKDAIFIKTQSSTATVDIIQGDC